MDNVTVRPVVHVSTCKICNSQAPLYGVADFNKSCEEARGRYLPLVGVPVYYHRCNHCGLVFTRAFDDWTKADYAQHIYNEDYVLIDPDYIDVRPASNAGFIRDFIKKGRDLKCLDYGGGNGTLARLLQEAGVDAHSWDPMDAVGSPSPSGPFDFISAFEVLEHTPKPVATVREALSMLSPRGVLVFSTLTIDHVPARGMDNWYIAPRNGHITLYTRRALLTLFEGEGYRVHHFNNNLHMALNHDPDWLS
ncbi:class I SAM-dependent methyltransferase [Caballeronia sp. DA-9]|uniref:class I SAM-dependent methyltransferase n=1 Tax=Caballeronia sp. DA-9 TaxID=3436237 RepID=UPI003F680F5C